MDIRRAARPWRAHEFRSRVDALPEKFEVNEGYLFFTEQERINLLGVLLENVGADRAVRLGDPRVWVEAVRDAHPRIARTRFLADSFNRWMLVLWCLQIAFVFVIAALPGKLPSLSPQASWLLVSALVAAVVSVGIHIFLWRPPQQG